MLPFAYCLQADKEMMVDTVLAGPDGVVGVDSFDPFCHQECEPRANGLYNMTECMSCYKNVSNLNAIKEKYKDAGGSYRTEPTTEQIVSCLDTYLPTLLTSEMPTIIQESQNNNSVSGYIIGKCSKIHFL